MLLPAAAAATTAETPPLPLPVAALPLPLLTLALLLLALLAPALLLLVEDLKEERRFCAEDLRRIEGRKVVGCDSEFEGDM